MRPGRLRGSAGCVQRGEEEEDQESMTRRPTRLSLASLGAAAALVVTMSIPGMAQDASPAASAAPMPGEQPPAITSSVTSYPNYGGEVDCAAGTFNGSPYTGNLKSITAPDAKTVVFTFCNPDVAFLSQIAFDSLAIDDADYLIAHMADGSIITAPNGTGPFKLTSWDRGNRMDFEANADYWGTKALSPAVELQWSDQAAARYVALQSGSVDGIDNPGKDDLAAIEGDSTKAFYPRQGLNTFYLGMNNTVKPFDNLKVRQAIAMGIDRSRIVDNFYPPGSEVATHFVPCAIPHSCAGDDWYTFNAADAKALLAEGLAEEGLPTDGFTTKLQFRAAVRGYLPDPPTIAQEIATQLETNLGIKVTLDLQESGTFLDNNAAGTLDGIFMLGWGADFPDASNFLDYHFGAGAGKKFGTLDPALVAAVMEGGRTADDAGRDAAYGKANDLIKATVPAVFIAHGGSGTAFQADVVGGYSSPLQETFAGMQAADRGVVVFMQNAEPLSLYCGDETDGESLRACHQMKESLYAYGGPAGLDTMPALATGCTANADLTVWTCALRDGVKFHDGSTLDASDVIVSFAAQWDARSSLHVGRTAAFEYWGALIGQGTLNPPPPAP